MTARALRKEGIKVTTFIDSAVGIALEGKQKTKKTDIVLLGADAILKNGVMNKVGSGAISKLAKSNKIPLYVVADSWKYSSKSVPIEERDFHEVWKKAPKNIKIRNPDTVTSKYMREKIEKLYTLFRKRLNPKKKAWGTQTGRKERLKERDAEIERQHPELKEQFPRLSAEKLITKISANLKDEFGELGDIAHETIKRKAYTKKN